jgi:hypothetical protein
MQSFTDNFIRWGVNKKGQGLTRLIVADGME